MCIGIVWEKAYRMQTREDSVSQLHKDWIRKAVRRTAHKRGSSNHICIGIVHICIKCCITKAHKRRGGSQERSLYHFLLKWIRDDHRTSQGSANLARCARWGLWRPGDRPASQASQPASPPSSQPACQPASLQTSKFQFFQFFLMFFKGFSILFQFFQFS